MLFFPDKDKVRLDGAWKDLVALGVAWSSVMVTELEQWSSYRIPDCKVVTW